VFGFSLTGLDIDETGIDAVKEPEGGPNVARSKCYGLVASVFSSPNDGLFEKFSDGVFEEQLAEASTELPYEIDLGIEAVPDDWSSDDFQAEYLRLFEVGAGGPPCPLFGGVWVGDRMQVMEEVVRFYNYFGLKTSDDRRIPPDHLSTELEFLHYLTYREAAAPMPGLAVPYRRAPLDFIERQPGRWVPKLQERLADSEAAPIFASLVDLTARLVESDRSHLVEQGEAPVRSPVNGG